MTILHQSTEPNSHKWVMWRVDRNDSINLLPIFHVRAVLYFLKVVIM